jgi:protein farnesyltransferase subunit beta
MNTEGGFQGRVNKLVDSCYSWWQGGLASLIEISTQKKIPTSILYRSQHLQAYVLGCCQDISGGIRDKPGKGADFYHTCYALSGLQCAQECGGFLGEESNLLEPTHPMFNVNPKKVAFAIEHFLQKNKEEKVHFS